MGVKYYSKRNFYLKKISYGKNNKGIITSRARQSTLFKVIHFKNKEYTFLFLRMIFINFISEKGIYIKIIGTSIDPKTKQCLFKICFLNSFLKNQIKYIPKTKKISSGDVIVLGLYTPLTLGGIVPMYKIPLGSFVHHIESIPTKGAVFVKSSKKSAYILSIGTKYITLKLPSGESRLLSKYVLCIYGELIFTTKKNPLYKAGDSRYFGKRPIVRGVAKNAYDHPHGGGEGKSYIGKKSSYSSWGRLFRGVKTRNKKKYSNIYIIKKE